jgi:hypothetical protein
MNQNSGTEQADEGAGVKKFSCLTCRQRKVRCDRRNPCSNCVRAARQCSFVAPVRGKRKKTKAPKEGLHAKLRRYEELLQSYGANIDPSEHDGSDADTASEAGTAEDGRPQYKSGTGSYTNIEESKSKLITRNGSSRYYDKYVCYCFRVPF